MRRGIIAIFAAVASAVFGLVGAGQAHALTQTTTSMSSGNLTVRTANGKAWTFNLGVSTNPGSSDDELDEYLVREQTKPRHIVENHRWTLDVPSSSMTFNSNSGTGTIKTPHSTSALTTLNLTFTTIRRRHASCSSGSRTIYIGTMSGQAKLDTQLRAGGTVGGRNVSFPKGTAEVVVENDCQETLPETEPCERSTNFIANGSRMRTLVGDAGPKHGSVEIIHGVTLGHPAGASRQDVFVGPSSRVPSFNAKAKTLQVWAGAAGPFTGTGRFSGGTHQRFTNDCIAKGVHHTEVYNDYSNAAFANGANHPLVAHTSLVGKMLVPNTNNTSYSISTWH